MVINLMRCGSTRNGPTAPSRDRPLQTFRSRPGEWHSKNQLMSPGASRPHQGAPACRLPMAGWGWPLGTGRNGKERAQFSGCAAASASG